MFSVMPIALQKHSFVTKRGYAGSRTCCSVKKTCILFCHAQLWCTFSANATTIENSPDKEESIDFGLHLLTPSGSGYGPAGKHFFLLRSDGQTVRRRTAMDQKNGARKSGSIHPITTTRGSTSKKPQRQGQTNSRQWENAP